MTKHDASPATKADLRELEQRMTVGSQKRFDYLNDSINQVLTVLTNINEKLVGRLENHERRLTRIETQLGLVA